MSGQLLKLSEAISAIQRLELQLTKDADIARQNLYANMYSTDQQGSTFGAPEVIPPRVQEIRNRRAQLIQEQQAKERSPVTPSALSFAQSKGGEAIEDF